MKKFLIDSAILKSGTDPKACALGPPQRLEHGYCCGPEGRVAFVVEAKKQKCSTRSILQNKHASNLNNRNRRNNTQKIAAQFLE